MMVNKLCSVDQCGKKHFARGLCNNHLNKLRRSEQPWMSHYNSARQRCVDRKDYSYKYYGAKGIRFLMKPSDFKFLWLRDKAHLLKQPSIDRIDSAGNYELNNCRFIEKSENLPRFKKACPRGHLYEGKNLMITKEGFRMCRTCHYESNRRHLAKRLLEIILKNRKHKRFCSKHQRVHSETIDHWSCTYPNDKERNKKKREWRKIQTALNKRS